jgi:hypothetical protein
MYLLVLSLPVIRLLVDLFEKKKRFLLTTISLLFRAFLVTASCPAFWVFATFPEMSAWVTVSTRCSDAGMHGLYACLVVLSGLSV